MSWSIQISGKVSKIIQALENESARLSGQSKTEYDAVKYHLKALVQANSDADEAKEPLVKIVAYGSAMISGNEVTESSCSCNIERIFLSHP